MRCDKDCKSCFWYEETECEGEIFACCHHPDWPYKTKWKPISDEWIEEICHDKYGLPSGSIMRGTHGCLTTGIFLEEYVTG